MKRSTVAVLSILFALASLPAVAQTLVPCAGPCAPRHYYERQPLTRAVPTGAPVAGTLGSGMSLSGIYGVRLSACAPVGQTFTGTGAFRAWLYITTGPDAGWAKSDTSLDLAMRAEWNGRRCVVWADYLPAVRLGHWVLYAADTVGMAGTAATPAEQDTVLFRIEGHQ